MNDSNPYEPPSAKSQPSSWTLIDYVVAGIWLAIPIGVFVGRQLLLPVFTDFGVELPTLTQSLLRFYSPFLFAIPSFVVLLAMFNFPHGSTRRRLVWLASAIGGLIVVICLLSFLVPLFSLWQNLG